MKDAPGKVSGEISKSITGRCITWIEIKE